MTTQMDRYKAMLQHLTPTSYEADAGQPQQLNTKMKPNQIYAVVTEDDPRYYRTVMIKQNDFTNGFSLNVSNPVMKIVPDGIQVVAQHAVFKQMREMKCFLLCAFRSCQVLCVSRDVLHVDSGLAP